ncbi:MAG: HNH endonuclease [Gammaproteobacteria bacterium]
MRYWWVNQNQTWRHEIGGGYLWSPKRKKNGARNPFYDFMREVAPGDVIFSFAETRIKAIGIANSHAYEAPKPIEFGEAGAYWDQIGWRVDVGFMSLSGPIRPSEYMDVLRPLLPRRYAPLHEDGRGLQSVYLTFLPESLAGKLIDLCGRPARDIIQQHQIADAELPPAVGLVQWEEHELAQVRADIRIPETDREAVIMARRGQGLFKQRVMAHEKKCRITGVDRIEHLRASHCKPWRDSSNPERLDGNNGLLLTPSIDHLFDRGFISFDDNGDVLVSPVAHRPSLNRMGIVTRHVVNAGRFSAEQLNFMDYHRDNVWLKSAYME